VGLVGAIYMGPPFSETGAAVVKALVWITSGALVVTAAVYARKVDESPAYFGGIGWPRASPPSSSASTTAPSAAGWARRCTPTA
jgi:hypothetical protein